ncbi:DsbA family protein [Pseudomonas aeruginosa]|uniref:DsbA family protein n=1 Tax=Pseudomonas aeruginosa TaxID=287 RepID=UPI0032614A39
MIPSPAPASCPSQNLRKALRNLGRTLLQSFTTSVIRCVPGAGASSRWSASWRPSAPPRVSASRSRWGGLRAGGGDPWNADFIEFLRAEWRRIGEVTGQPFGFTLLDAPYFDYDTEPACRAVVCAQILGADSADPSARRFFSAVQRRFYVEGRDPKETSFYADLCEEAGLDFGAFRSLFLSAEARQATQAAFLRCRQWGVRAFPTLAVERRGELLLLAAGFTTREQVLSRLRRGLAG